MASNLERRDFSINSSPKFRLPPLIKCFFDFCLSLLLWGLLMREFCRWCIDDFRLWSNFWILGLPMVCSEDWWKRFISRFALFGCFLTSSELKVRHEDSVWKKEDFCGFWGFERFTFHTLSHSQHWFGMIKNSSLNRDAYSFIWTEKSDETFMLSNNLILTLNHRFLHIEMK